MVLSDIAWLRGCDQAYYRVHDDSLLRSRSGTLHADLLQRRRAFELFFEAARQQALLEERVLMRLQHNSNSALTEQALKLLSRALLGDQDAPSSAGQYLAFAQELDPLRASAGWRTLDRRPQPSEANRRSNAVRRIRRSANDVVGALRWRRWRRLGTCRTTAS